MIRLFNRLLTLIIGLALIAGGLLVIVEGISNWTNSGFVGFKGSGWVSSFKTTAWSAPIVIGVAAGVAVLGLVLFGLQVRPHRKRVASYKTGTGEEWFLLRRSTEAYLQRRLAARVPVHPIKARLKPGSRKWSLTVKARAAASSRPVLESAGRSELETLHAPGSSRVKVKTTGTGQS